MDDENIRNDINALFMGRLGKAVKYDSARVYFWGRMSLANFTLSRSSDFNDNLPLLKCDSAVVKIRFIDLLRKRISIKSIEIEKGTISLQKQSDEGTSEFLESLFPDNDKKSGAVTGLDFDMILDDVSLNLKIFTVNEVVIFQAENLSSTIRCGHNSVSWELEGDVLPRIPGVKTGDLRAEGAVYLSGNRINAGKAAFGLTNVDMRYFSPLIEDKFNMKVSVSGLGDISSSLAFAGKSCSFSNTCIMNDFRMVDTTSGRKMIDRDIISLHTSGEYLRGGKFRIRNFSANDGNISMRGSGVLVYAGDRVKTIAGKLHVDPFDLNDFALSYPVSVSSRFNINGSFGCDGYLSYDRINGICDLIRGASRTKKITISSGSGEGAVKYLEGNLDADCDSESIRGKSSGKYLDEPYEISSNLFIRRMRPFSTLLTLDASFRQGSFDIMKSLASSSVGKFIEKVYDDRRGGYEDIKFLETFAGRMLNNNDVNAKLRIAQISVGTNKKGFTDCEVAFALNNGTMKFEMSSLKGFDAKYNLSGDGILHTDYPQMKITAGVSEFNLAEFASCGGIKGVKGGKGALTFQYSMNGNRLAHFVDNGTIDLTADISGLILDGNGFAESFGKYVRKYNSSADFSVCAISQGGIAFHQTGENGFIQKMSLTSDRGNINGFGKYTYEKGLIVSGEISTTGPVSSTGAAGLFASAPFDITGTLAKPVFSIRVKNSDPKKPDGFRLF